MRQPHLLAAAAAMSLAATPALGGVVDIKATLKGMHAPVQQRCILGPGVDLIAN
jgi:hypothetical protein